MNLGFIGCGVMANAIMGGVIRAGLYTPDQIWGADPFEGSRKKTEEANGIHVTADNNEVIRNCETVFFAVKPQYYDGMIDGIKDQVRNDQLFISIGAGRTLDYLADRFGKPVKIIRVMPNTPAQVGEGMSAACPNQYVTEEEKERGLEILRAFGKAEIMPESLFDIVTGVSGSGPAYVFMFIEAMADAAVNGGMKRDQAYIFAAQTVLGSAKMVLDTGKHPGALKDMVTSPAGTTIAGVRALEKGNLRSTVFEGVMAATDKSAEMRKG
ncbi:MAG: pyrroline-5-carboxylate reductase [Bilifractor sp.]|jgi:pyrroline-5-carboxylate reductase|nr:pyrroline-5-carboxylate reductase [Lachnospiraceae bacterium]